ncbi:uncharacterized protein LOC130946071 [Arachis stenosperma]|uniref:uncharacterized protein LOC130946071 n=1 Tax=Arachis stenosperma TaxID=217475 RepID=UPI0025AC4E35|nr:uncharacterized protein LOC130946071 [Arachis stenosperma]
MDREKSLMVLVHCSGKIKKSNRHGVKFTDKEPLSIFIRSTDTLSDLKRNILQKAWLVGAKSVKKMFYKISMAVVSSGVQYETFVIGSDEDMGVLFHCRPSFSEVRIQELFTKLEDRVDSFGASAPNPQSTTVGDASTSMPIVAPRCLLSAPPPVLAPAERSPSLITGFVGSGEPDHYENAMRDYDSDDEPDHISGDSEDETPVPLPAPQRPSSSGSHQQPSYFSTLNLESTKEEAVMSVKDYTICRGVHYRVMESDHLKYVGRCKEFGNGYNWIIRVALRQHKGNWEVRRYNGAHTCLATSISSDHRQLDYHVICARIYPLVRADTTVTIKVLQEATESTYRFRPSYKKVWKVKQKAVVQIYGDWEESYVKLPRWILGMQATMDGSVALLKTSPVRVGCEVDESTYIDGTHLYGKYGGTLLLAIAQDGNSNILPVAFALVEGENEGILVISDRPNDIKAALEVPDSGWKPPHAYRAHCIQHIAANFALSFKGQDARRMLVNAAYAKTEAEFDYWFDIMRTENLAMCDWANRNTNSIPEVMGGEDDEDALPRGEEEDNDAERRRR